MVLMEPSLLNPPSTGHVGRISGIWMGYFDVVLGLLSFGIPPFQDWRGCFSQRVTINGVSLELDGRLSTFRWLMNNVLFLFFRIRLPFIFNVTFAGQS